MTGAHLRVHSVHFRDPLHVGQHALDLVDLGSGAGSAPASLGANRGRQRGAAIPLRAPRTRCRPAAATKRSMCCWDQGSAACSPRVRREQRFPIAGPRDGLFFLRWSAAPQRPLSCKRAGAASNSKLRLSAGREHEQDPVEATTNWGLPRSMTPPELQWVTAATRSDSERQWRWARRLGETHE